MNVVIKRFNTKFANKNSSRTKANKIINIILVHKFKILLLNTGKKFYKYCT